MHRIYEDEGVFNFIYLIPQMIYSILISSIINYIITFLSLSDKTIIEIKKEKDIQILKLKAPKTLKILKIKFICFFSLSLLFLILIWYYISCFCAVYRNAQIYLLKNILISFGISLIYPFFIALIPSVIRVVSLYKPGKCLYKLSKIIQ